jgi:hypothetical protein
MTWNPNCSVAIDGVDFSAKTINAVRITYGRSSYWEQARSGNATVEIVNWDDTDYGFDINDSLVITVDNASATARTVFTGKVTSVATRMAAVGSVKEVSLITISAVGPFAGMSRKIIGTSGYLKELDSARMTEIFTDAGVTVDVVDSPGIYEFAAMDAAPVDAYTEAAKYAGMANGYIYETADGEVGFANESRRTVEVATNGYMSIPENYILWRSVASQKALGDVLNEIRLSYKDNAVVTSSDATSQTLYGLLGASISTELHNLSEAQELADKYVALRRVPRLNVSAFTVQLDSPSVTSANLDAFLQMKMGKPITIAGLPIPLVPTNYYGFVEGWTLAVSRNQAAISLITSESSYSIQPTRWQDVSASLAWNAVGATVQWATYD